MFQHLLSALSMRRPDSDQKQPVGKENAEPWGDWADLPEEADAKLGCSGWMGRIWMPWGAERICWRWHGTGRAPEVGASWAGAHRDGRLTDHWRAGPRFIPQPRDASVHAGLGTEEVRL